MKIRDLDIQNRPRERLIEYGPNALSDVELLAILLGSGVKNEGVYEMSSRILKEYSYSQLSELNYNEIIKIYGIKKAKACKLLSCFEIARRSLKKEITDSLSTSNIIFQYIYHEFCYEKKEIIGLLIVDCKLRCIKKKLYRMGNVSNIEIPIKNIIEESLVNKGYGIILIHNHPSGDVNPSKSDIISTLELKSILLNLDIVLLDHLIVSHSGYYSFSENGILDMNHEYYYLGE